MPASVDGQFGVTLIELMVAVAILAIVTAVALPAFQTSVANNRVKGQANDLLTAFSLAKSEAVKRNTSVYVCPSNSDSTLCSGTNWSTGWIVTTSSSTTTAGTVVRAFSTLSGGTTVQPANVSAIEFSGSGFTGTSYNFDLCTGNSSAPKRRVELLASGFATVLPNASSATTC
jgi:type IV fimbrial biogenesis protein FimT